MSNKGRVITLVCEILTEEYPPWIFDSHLGKNFYEGVKVKEIHEGNVAIKDEEETHQKEQGE